MTYTSITAAEFERMDVAESHALAVEAQRYRMADFKAWIDVLGQFMTALAGSRVG